MYKVTLKMCTLHNGLPDGPAHIILHDPHSHYYSFEGVGVFHEGELHLGPFICINGLGFGLKFVEMKNGRPAQD